MTNARFYIFWNDEPTKLTLSPGQVVNLYRGGNTEEGWAREFLTLEHTGEGVRREWSREERDCDGRFDKSGEDYCSLADLRAYWNPHSEVHYPAWERVESRQRDHSAEAMRY